MYSAIDIARLIISYCTECGRPISNLQLQKILYYLQAFYLKKTSNRLFRDDICAWPYGPVIPEVYYTFSGYGGSNIAGLYDCGEIDSHTMNLIMPELERLRRFSSWQLVEFSHTPGAPWDTVFKGGRGDRKVINTDIIRNDQTIFQG